MWKMQSWNESWSGCMDQKDKRFENKSTKDTNKPTPCLPRVGKNPSKIICVRQVTSPPGFGGGEGLYFSFWAKKKGKVCFFFRGKERSDSRWTFEPAWAHTAHDYHRPAPNIKLHLDQPPVTPPPSPFPVEPPSVRSATPRFLPRLRSPASDEMAEVREPSRIPFSLPDESSVVSPRNIA